MKTQIEIKATLYKKVSSEAARAGYTVDQWLAEAAEKQLRRSEELRRFVAEKSKGASKEKAKRALKEIRKWVGLPPVEGDEMPV